jgi:hypothetical protein
MIFNSVQIEKFEDLKILMIFNSFSRKTAEDLKNNLFETIKKAAILRQEILQQT